MCTVCQRPLWWCVRLLMLLSECHWLIAYFRVSDLWVELRLFVELMRTVCHWDRCDSVLDVCCYCSYDWITSLSTSCSGTDCWITFHCVPLWLVLIKKKLVSGAQLNLRIRSCVAAIAQMMWLNADDRLWCFHGEAFCHLGWCDIGCLMKLLLFDVIGSLHQRDMICIEWYHSLFGSELNWSSLLI